MALLKLDAIDPPIDGDDDDAAPGSKHPGGQAAPKAFVGAAAPEVAPLGMERALPLFLPRGGLPGSSGRG